MVIDGPIRLNTDNRSGNIPEQIAIIPIVNSPIFPGMIAPIVLSEDKFIKELEDFVNKTGFIGLNLVKYKESEDKIRSTKNPQAREEQLGNANEDEAIISSEEKLQSKDIYTVGVICKIVKKIRLSDGSINLLVHGMTRYRVKGFTRTDKIFISRLETLSDQYENDEELDAYTRSVINQVKKLSDLNPYFNEEMKLAMLNSPSPGYLVDLVAFSLSLDIPEIQDFLETLIVKKRFEKLLVYLRREKDVADIQKKITNEVNDKVNKYQKEYFLKEQLKIIRKELGFAEDEKSSDISKLKSKLAKMNLPEDARKAVDEELEKISSISEHSPEYNVSRTYLTWILKLPWNKESREDIDIEKSKKILTKDHFGLEKPKERILEFLAVRKLKSTYDGTILCFIGPPGVGKTSLGQSIAKSLSRKFYRFSLGGMRDEAEIKGHRRTYIGAMPGKLLQALKRVEVNNPVIMLDEIDKMGRGYDGVPASALLEVLDPEQNKTFIDNYLDVPFDLSKVLFIATANYKYDIPSPLLDRMEEIYISGYTHEEKASIATSWILPKQIKKHGLTRKDIGISAKVIKKVILDYARGPGVRNLEQVLAKLCRKVAFEKVSAKKKFNKFSFTTEKLDDFLGPPIYSKEMDIKNLKAGMSIGLAWTQLGGEVLMIESIPLEGKGLKVTGQLGDVMNESAALAYSYVRSLLQKEDSKKIKKKKVIKKSKTSDKDSSQKEEAPTDFLDGHDIHIHIPEGATPKDGPSAGITLATALYGLSKNKKMRPLIAMTGELSLTGKVLPVGGIKEKTLAAKRIGIKEIIIPAGNNKDIKEVPKEYIKGITFHPVETFEEVLKIAFR